MKKFGNLSEMWDAFRAFKKQVPSKDYDKVLKELDEFKASVDDLYYVEKYKDENKRKMEEEVAKILNIKKNFITKKHSILGWEMPPAFIPYVEKGEDVERMPKRAYDAYMAMLTNSEFNMLCNSNYKYMEEYDKFIIDWLSNAYNIDKGLVEYNLNKVIAVILNENGIEKKEFKELLEPQKPKEDNYYIGIPEDKIEEVDEWFSKHTLYGTWPVFTGWNPSIVELGVDMSALEAYYHKLTNNRYK